jgi:galactokinase
LSEISLENLPEIEKMIAVEIIRKRVRHVITENRRVLEAVKALHLNDYMKFGILMSQSHDSLRDDYEVTGFELDTMVKISRQQKGVLGSRMTGAGFGGCTVSLVQTDMVEEFITNVKPI